MKISWHSSLYALLFLAGIEFVISCREQIAPILEIDKESLTVFVERQSDSSMLKTPCDSIASVSVRDGVISAFFLRNQSTHALVLYDMDFHEVRRYGEYGAKFNQVVLPRAFYADGVFLLGDVAMKKVAWIEWENALSDSLYCPPIFKSNIVSQYELPFENRILFLNPYSYQGREPRILVSDRKLNYHWRKKHDYTAINLMDGTLLHNKQIRRVAYFSGDEPLIELMDEKGKIIKSFLFPHERGTVGEMVHNGITEYAYYAPGQRCFVSASSDADYIVASYWTDERESIVLLFDWEGKILDGFRTGKEIKQVSVSAKNKCVYCWETDGTFDYLNKYFLNVSW